ncbi:hypothetical protein G7085_15950 [Tessaracoccus sp. HDW20]|uniref:hypothetical protein n=1 Tax=Tessaracoccus coleopterorum TaxID=2714950 RepID=UPI0018D48848|nr:hypothetical protein [Tessaracoccus coleopterorum]NHB85587.1 hypothetical protein [Tessaracoccus coleopterorum]
MTSDGVLVVAAHAGALRGADGPTDVRLDVVRQTGDATLPVIASSIHVLGRLTWLDEEAARSLGLPDLVADLVGCPGCRWGDRSRARRPA